MEDDASAPVSNSGASAFSTPLLISTLGIMITSMVIVLYHFFLIRYCKIRSRSSSANNAAAEPTGQSPITGVPPDILETVPIYIFFAVKRENYPKDCAVCLCEMEDEELVRFLPDCKHAFHLPCIDLWFHAHDSCPLCRTPVSAPRQNSGDDDSNPSPSVNNHGADNESNREINLPGTSNVEETASSSTPRAQSFGLLRHCVSMVLPAAAERRPSRLMTGLKRSLSVDQSFVVINLQRENPSRNDCTNSSSLSSSDDTDTESSRSESYRTRTLNHFDRMSSILLRSLSRLRLGKDSTETILPY